LHRRYAHVTLVFVLALSVTYSVVCAGSNDKVLLVDLDTAITGATTEMMEDAARVATNVDARLILVTADTPGGEINAVKDVMNLFEASTPRRGAEARTSSSPATWPPCPRAPASGAPNQYS